MTPAAKGEFGLAQRHIIFDTQLTQAKGKLGNGRMENHSRAGLLEARLS